MVRGDPEPPAPAQTSPALSLCSVMFLQFVPKTHLFFTAGKDKKVKQWDADKFEHIQTLEVSFSPPPPRLPTVWVPRTTVTQIRSFFCQSREKKVGRHQSKALQHQSKLHNIKAKLHNIKAKFTLKLGLE